MVLQTSGARTSRFPGDFARHCCDATYRPTVEAIAALGRQTIGERRASAGSAGLTQEVLARSAHVGRVILVRLERGLRPPRFRTLKAVRDALGMEVPDLLVEAEFLPR